MVHLAQAAPHKIDVVKRGENGEEERCAEKKPSREPYPVFSMHLKKHDKKHRRHLREGVGLAKNAGPEVAQPRYGVEHAADEKNADVSRENQHREFPRNEIDDRQNQENGAKQHFVGDGVEILAEQSLLMQAAGKQAVKAIAQAGQQREDERALVVVVEKLNDDKG